MNGNTAIKHTEPDKNVASAIDQKARNRSDKWMEVIALAEKYGFIQFIYGRVAMLSIYEEAMERGEL